MSRSSRESSSKINPLILVFPLTMGIIGYFVLSKTAPTPTSGPTPITAEAPAPTSTTVLLGRAQQGADRDQAFIYDLTTQTLTPTSTSVGWRLPIRSSVTLTQRSQDSVWLLTAPDWSVALRNARGNSYQDPLYIGPFDETHFAVAAISSDRRLILSVSRAGVIRELASLSDETVPLAIQDQNVWLVESAAREGIELPPHGPSRVWSLTKDGATSTLILDERTNTLVTDVVSSRDDVALVSDLSDIRLWKNGILSTPISGKPLGWIEGHRLLFIQNGRLCTETMTSPPVCGPTASTDLALIKSNS